jgi:hypothetical protein
MLLQRCLAGLLQHDRAHFALLPLPLLPPPLCSFQYDLDRTGLRALGNGSSVDGGSGPGLQTLSLDTTSTQLPPTATSNTSAVLAFSAVVLGSDSAATSASVLGSTFIEARLDDALFWTTLALDQPYVVQDLSEGMHAVEARAR